MRKQAVAILSLALVCAGAAFAEPVKVKVDSGTLVGSSEDGIASFKGVPFAAPPVEDLRWKPPQPVAAWQGEQAATEFGPGCMQPSRGDQKFSENCLYLNVYAPAKSYAPANAANKGLPVMVWIHGGSNISGSGSIYNGAAFAKSGVVAVTVNYRMGAFGFYAHPELTKAAGAADPLANYGLMDQTAALQWVQKNIAAFGGDPSNVTVFGESAGAINIYGLLGLKTSKGLFSKAILQSNITWGDSAPLAKAEADGKALAVRAGLTETATLADLRALPADKLVAAAQGALFPIVDGRFMTESSISAVKNGHAVDVPLIVGTNSYEASLIARNTQDPKQLTDWTNAQAGAPARFIAAKSASGAPSWLYFFSYVPPACRADSRGAAHAAEIPYVFNGPRACRPGANGEPVEPNEEVKQMAALMHSCWVGFAQTGEPKCASGPAWPKYDPASDKLMEFGVESGVRTNFRKPELDAALAAEASAK